MKRCHLCGMEDAHTSKCPAYLLGLLVDYDFIHGKPLIVTDAQRAGKQTVADLLLTTIPTEPDEFLPSLGQRIVKGRGTIPGGLDNLPKDKRLRMDYKPHEHMVLGCTSRAYQQGMYAHMLHESHMRIARELTARGYSVEIVGDSMMIDIESRSGRLSHIDFSDIERRIEGTWGPKVFPEQPAEEDKPKACKTVLSLLARAQGSKVKVE